MHSNRASPRIALYDIETSPILAHVWTMFDTNVVAVERPSLIISFAAKWLGEEKVTTRCLADYPGYKRDRFNDRALCLDLHKMMSSADVIVAHNGDAFDIKKSNARFAIHNLQPPAPYKTFDTLKAARKSFKFDSNKLNNLGQTLGLGAKLPHTGIHLWLKCLEGDEKSWKLMRRYNAQDVRLLESLYLRIRPWSPNHPNLNLYTASNGCPSCQSRHVIKRGFGYSKAMKRQRYLCLDCGAWHMGEAIKS